MINEEFRFNDCDTSELEFSSVTLSCVHENIENDKILNTYTVQKIEGPLAEQDWIGKSFTKEFGDGPGEYLGHSSYENAVGHAFREKFFEHSVLEFNQVGPGFGGVIG